MSYRNPGVNERAVREVQERIALAVARAIEKELGVAAANVPTPLAYEQCLKARYELSRMTPASVGRAIDLFESAIAADAEYAPAHAGLVQAYVVYVLWGFAAPDDSREHAKKASELALALALDGDHAEALAAAAAYELIYEWNVERAQEILDRAAGAAIQSDAIPTMQGLVFLARGRLDDAEGALAQSIARAPHAPFVHYLRASVAFIPAAMPTRCASSVSCVHGRRTTSSCPGWSRRFGCCAGRSTSQQRRSRSSNG